MKKVLFLLTTVALVIASCKSNIKNKVNIDQMKQYFIKGILKDSTKRVDSFRLVSIDTATERNCYIVIQNTLYDQQTDNSNQMADVVADMKNISNEYDLMSDNPYAGSLLRRYKNDMNADMEKAKNFLLEDSLYKIDIKRLDTLIEKADTIKPVYYIANCIYQVQKGDFSVERDTAIIRLNTDFKIISFEKRNKLFPVFNPVSDFYLPTK